MDEIKEALKKAIKGNIKASGGAMAEDAREYSQAALNLSATLAQIVNIEVAETHLALDRRDLENDDPDKVAPEQRVPGQGVH